MQHNTRFKKAKYLFLSHCLKGSLQRRNEILCLLNAHGQADGVGLDILLQKLLLCALAVGGGRRVNHQGFHVRHIRQQGENGQVVDKGLGRLRISLDLKGEMEPPPFGRYFLYSSWVGSVGSDG